MNLIKLFLFYQIFSLLSLSRLKSLLFFINSSDWAAVKISCNIFSVRKLGLLRLMCVSGALSVFFRKSFTMSVQISLWRLIVCTDQIKSFTKFGIRLSLIFELMIILVNLWRYESFSICFFLLVVIVVKTYLWLHFYYWNLNLLL